MKTTQTKEALERVMAMLRVPTMVPQQISLRANGGGTIDDLNRQELLNASLQGEHVGLEVDAVVFRQSKTKRPLAAENADEANANFVLVRPRDMKKLAKGFKGQPFLRDHDRGNLMAVGGEIVDSRLVETEQEFIVEHTLSLVKPWAVQAALDGTLKQFSVGFDVESHEQIVCTECRCALLTGDCNHFPGDEVATKNGTRIVEAEFRNPSAAEVSGVSFPAVQGTSVDGIRSALSEARTLIGSARKQGGEMNEATKKALGLSADASDESVAKRIAELTSQAGRIDELEKKNQEQASELSEATGALKEAQGQLATVVKSAQETRAAELRAKAIEKGLWAPGSKQEKYFAKLAARSVDEAEEYMSTLEPVIPVNAGLQSGSKPSTETATPDSLAAFLADEYNCTALAAEIAQQSFRQLGVTRAMLEEHGPHIERDGYTPWLRSN